MSDLEYGVLYEAEVDEKYRGVKQVAGVVSEADMVSQEVGPEPRVLYWYSPLILNTHSQTHSSQYAQSGINGGKK